MAPLQTKLAESEDKVALMSQQIEQLQAERATLMDRNSILEQVCNMSVVHIAFIHHLHILAVNTNRGCPSIKTEAACLREDAVYSGNTQLAAAHMLSCISLPCCRC